MPRVCDDRGGRTSLRPPRNATKQTCNAPTDALLKSEVCGDEAADRAFCADPLAKSPCSSAARRSVLCFPLPPCFSFSERPLWHGSSRKSTAEKLPRKTFIFPICNSSLAELFLFYTHCLRHMYAPIFLCPVDLRKYYFERAAFSTVPCSFASCPKKAKTIHGGNSNENVGYQAL